MAISELKLPQGVSAHKFKSPVLLAEGLALRAAVQKYGVVFQWGTQQRSSVNYRLTAELVRNGYIGDVRNIMIGSAGGSPPKPEPPSSSGGAVTAKPSASTSAPTRKEEPAPVSPGGPAEPATKPRRHRRSSPRARS